MSTTASPFAQPKEDLRSTGESFKPYRLRPSYDNDRAPLLENGDGEEGEYEGDIIDIDGTPLNILGGARRTREDIRLPTDGGSILESFLNMTNSIIGAGIIGLPFSFREAGFWMGVILLVGLTWTVDWTVRLLMHNGKLAGRDNYQDLMLFCYGKPGLIVISIFQFVFAFGAMCAYSVIIGDTIPNVLETVFPNIRYVPILNLLASRRFIIVFCTIVVSYPLSLYRDISKLAKTSAIALIAIIVIIIAVVIEGPRMPAELRGSSEGKFSFVRAEVFQAIGVISFAFVCHHNSFLIFDSLRKPSLNRFAIVTHASMFISLLACLVLALSGYLVFTDKTMGNILNNFPKNSFLINIARFCFGLNMFTTLPLETFVCREVIENYFYPSSSFSLRRHVLLTTTLVFSPMFIALATCNLGFVLELTGGFSATALAFILPSMLYLKLTSGPAMATKNLMHLLMIGFGFIVMMLSTFFSIHKAWKGDGGGDSCAA